VDNLTYLDLLVLLKLDENSVIERFGPVINTSFFETANLLGSLKVKGYLDLESSIGGMSRISITEHGRQVMHQCEQKTLEPLDSLDEAILSTIATGVSDSERLAQRLNVRPADLAVHLNKLCVQAFIESTVKSAKVGIALTEKGFNKVGIVRGTQQAMQGGSAGIPEATQVIQADSQAPAKEAASGQQSLAQDASDDAKEIIFGMFPKSKEENKLLAQPKPQAQPKSSQAQASQILTQASNANSAKQITEPGLFAKQTGIGSVAASATQQMEQTHSQTPQEQTDVKAMRLQSKTEYYLRHFFWYVEIGIVLLVGIGLAIFLSQSLKIKLF